MWEHLPARWQDLTRSDSGMDNLVSLYQWHFDLSNELPWSCSYVFLLLINFFYNFAGKNTHGDELYACLWFSWSFFKVALEIWSPWTFVALSGKPMASGRDIYWNQISVELLTKWFDLTIQAAYFASTRFKRKDKGTNMLLVSFKLVTSLL